MNNEISNLNRKFWDSLDEIYLNPDLSTPYLVGISKEIEKIIIKKFNALDLSSNYSMYAIGGFGKQEMFPSSDIDISIIKNNNDRNKEAELEKFITSLWDLGFKIGCSVRSSGELKKMLREDAKELTSYFSMRGLISIKQTDRIVEKVVAHAWHKKNYFKAKILEQADRYRSFDSSAFNLEPDLKESPGTMRDFQNSEWILGYCLDLKNKRSIEDSEKFNRDYKNAKKSYAFMKAMRYSVNISTKFKNRLNFESQIDIANKAITENLNQKQKVEMMMQDFFSHAQTISNFNELVLQVYEEEGVFALKKKRGNFFIKKNQIGILNRNLGKNKGILFDIFIELGKNKKINQINSESIGLLKKWAYLIDDDFRNSSVNASKFLEILRSKHHLSSILRLMKTVGILQKYIPEFGEVIGQMQFDLFHIYTVDEHTFKVVRNMRQMKISQSEEFKLENELIKKIPKIEILYIAGLFHDLGKGKGGNHSEIGAKTSRNFAKRLGLSVADSELISWLVLNHLKMSSISQRKDLTDAKTIYDFSEIVLNTERLDYLYLLTINDIRSTNPKLWNAWKHGLLKDLFLATRSFLNKEPIKASKEISEDRKNSVFSLLNKSDVDALRGIWSKFDDYYFNKNSSDKLKWQSELILSKSENDIKVSCRKCFDNLLEIFIEVENSDGLFLKLVQVLDEVGLEIIDASICTSQDNQVALNTFIAKFHSHDNPLLKNEIKNIRDKIIKNFSSPPRYENIKKSLKKKDTFQKKFKISNIEDKVSKKNLLTVEAFNTPGLLVKIAKILHENSVSIQSARINTLGDRVEDTFEIEDITISSVSNRKIEKISKALEEVI